MSECPDCDVMRKRTDPRDLYPCSLCQEKRCADHTIWVPSHELEKYAEEVKRVHELLREDSVSGWYAFCGKGTHIPRGVSIRFGKEKEGGKIVETVTDDEKRGGLEFFKKWEVGIIESSIEKRWAREHYTLSCSLAPAMIAIGSIIGPGGDESAIRDRIYDKVLTGIAARKEFLHVLSRDAYLKLATDASTIKDYAGILCSFCGIIPCVNRQKEYYNLKKFQKMVKDPNLLVS